MRAGSCIHFNGLMSDTCKAGHLYTSVAISLTEEQINWHNENYPGHDITRTVIGKRVPCFVENCIQTCSDFREPTQEELDQFEEQIKVAIMGVTVTRKAIVEYIEANGQKGRNWGGEIPCDICKTGTVIFSYAGGFNGHIHARCSTPGCVQWIE